MLVLSCLEVTGASAQQRQAAEVHPPRLARIPRALEVREVTTGFVARPQAQQPVYKTSGTDFFLAFPSALGSDSPKEIPYKRVYISSRSQVRGVIRLVGGGWQQSFVTNPTAAVAIDLPAWAGLERSETEQAYKRVFEIQAQDEIAVYALSHHHLSSDGFLVLPTEALGMKYAISSARNSLNYFGGRARPINPFTLDTVPRSECLIVGTQDATTITFTPSCDSHSGKFIQGKTYTFTLNSGEVMEVCARDTGITSVFNGILSWTGKLSNTDCDLTGSLISSDKPIAVFSGNERASIPDSMEFAYVKHPIVSRDHIVDQMPPIESWGKTFAFIPSSVGARRSRPASGDLVRLIAASNNTTVSFNGSVVAQLSSGAFKQFALNKATLITSTQPLLVVKYLQSAIDPDTVGDPDMTVLPPIENMSTYYTLPTISSNGSFTEHYVAILCDSAARSATTLNGYLLVQSTLKPFPGTRYYYGVIGVGAGIQRIESSLPCYAEAYGYGNLDSYTFTGGGSFPYLHALRAVDLDFGRIAPNTAKDSFTNILADPAPLPLGEQSEVYQYSWESGDTSAFSVLDTLRATASIAPGGQLGVAFRFKPTREGWFHAVLRVWSNNRTPVLITVSGIASNDSSSTLLVSPLDFGRVRVGDTAVGTYILRNTGPATIAIKTPNPPIVDKPELFQISRIVTADGIGNNIIRYPIPGMAVDTVRYTPIARSFDSVSAYIYSDAIDTPIAMISGRGVDYEIPTTTIDFGTVRVRESSRWASTAFIDSNWSTRTLTNFGDDTVGITSIALAGGDVNDFEIDYSSPKSNAPPPISGRWLLDTVGSIGNTNSYRIRFSPKFDPASGKVDTALHLAYVKIETEDDRAARRVRYDTVFGVGVEPYLKITNPVLDFGTFVNPTSTVVTMLDTLLNVGSTWGIVDSLRHSNPDFEITTQTLPVPDGMNVAAGASIELRVDFHIRSVGIYNDTVYINNDSRNRPLFVLKANVRADLSHQSPLTIDSVSSCDPIDLAYDLHNTAQVSIVIDTITFAGDSGGFSFTDVPNLRFPIAIAGDSIFTLHLRYLFPIDSLNGTQVAKMVLHRPSFRTLASYEYDTITITLTRTINQLQFLSALPPYKPSAGDAPFRLPIYLKGKREGLTNLDFDTVKVRFDNDMIQPVGIDRSGSLTDESLAGIPAQPVPFWDSAARTYCVPLLAANLSHNTSKNDLLFTLLCKTYITVDTTTFATVSVAYSAKPCGFRVAPHSTQIDYANECGNQTIRELMRFGNSAIISISSPYPDPVNLSNHSSVTVGFEASIDGSISWQLVDTKGNIITRSGTEALKKGTGSLEISASGLPTSGLYFLQITASDNTGQISRTITTKFSVIH
ncbi:MAG: hypothetical protein JSS75_03355 [Bacteroidetes bacterium]|nr:hypothetical protein [Bacteroidota bacterium]